MDPEGLRQRKKRERRQRIEEVALDLFEENGFEGTTVDDIARAADIAPRTFFSYFETKEDAVLADYASRLERIVDETELRLPAEPPWTALRSAFVAVATDYEAQRSSLVRRFAIMDANPSVLARSLQLQVGWEKSVTAVLLAGSDQPDDIDARLIASAALAAMRSALGHWIVTGCTKSLPDLLVGCFERLGLGLQTTRTAP